MPALTNWVVLPRRLAQHPDAGTARFYSLQRDVAAAVDFATAAYRLESLTVRQQQAWRVGQHAWS